MRFEFKIKNSGSRLKLPQRRLRALFAFCGFLGLWACAKAPAAPIEPSVRILRVVPESDLENLDPISTTADITRHHGYMIYDTLFGTDESGQISPQMVNTFEHSADMKTWTFTLRDGLEFHDGSPVTSEDVIASLQRWGQRDTMGQILLSFLKPGGWIVVNAKTFRMEFLRPYSLVLESLGKPGAYVPFIMPQRVASTPANEQITDLTGSGPFIFRKEERIHGSRVVYVRNARYRPRAEPASGTAGGKVVKVDRVEWIIIRDSQTQANALAAGEVDMIIAPAFEMNSSLQSNPNIQMVLDNPLGRRFHMRFNHLQPPFDNVKVRQAAMAAMNQLAFLQTQIGKPELYRTCFSIYTCKTPYATAYGMDFIASPDLKRAQQMLIESGYKGTPVVLLRQTDVANENRLADVARQLLTQAGFTVNVQSMDWKTLVSRRSNRKGWNLFISSGPSVSYMSPLSSNIFSAACEKAWVGWPCDKELEMERLNFALASTAKERAAIADRVQARAMSVGTHVPLGEYVIKVAARKNIAGFVTGYFTVFWNLEKH